MEYVLRFKPNEIDALARQYVEQNNDQSREDKIDKSIGPAVKTQGFYTKEDLSEICKWKAPRIQKFCLRNDDSYVRDVTSIALGSKNERLRIEVLTLLDGVDWPTASVLLHFGSADVYPILDFRALWSLTISQPRIYSFDFWFGYVQAFRSLVNELSVQPRTLDRALWQYSKLHQQTEMEFRTNCA